MFEIETIESGFIMADGGAMFGAVPKRAWQRKYEANADNLCPLTMRCVFCISEGREILIDTGMGDKHLDKVSYYQPYGLKNISDILKSYGYEASDITDVILTHLHFDHCGYATRKNENGEIVPSFPNARYWLSRKQWMTFLEPNRLEADSIFADNILPVYDAGLLQLVDEDMDICEDISIRLFDGHTEGQIAVYVNTDEGVHIFPGDLIPTSAHVSLEWISAYDINALASVMEKDRFLSEAAGNDSTLIYCHDAKVVKSKVKKLNDNYIAYDKCK